MELIYFFIDLSQAPSPRFALQTALVGLIWHFLAPDFPLPLLYHRVYEQQRNNDLHARQGLLFKAANTESENARFPLLFQGDQ